MKCLTLLAMTLLISIQSSAAAKVNHNCEQKMKASALTASTPLLIKQFKTELESYWDLGDFTISISKFSTAEEAEVAKNLDFVVEVEMTTPKTRTETSGVMTATNSVGFKIVDEQKCSFEKARL